MAATETLKTTYRWSDFDLLAALTGSLVGIEPTDSDAGDGIGRNTGKLRRTTSTYYARYVVTLDGNTCYVNDDGTIQQCASDSWYIGKQLKMCDVTLAVTYGSKQPTTRVPSADEGVKGTVTLASLEIRDTFAIYALQGLMRHCGDNPIYYDDANILSVCAASYRWAQGMMQAAADARELIKNGDDGDGDSDEDDNNDSGGTRNEVNVTDGTTTEKLLSNLVTAVDDLTSVQKKMFTTTGEGDSAKTTLSIPDLNLKQPIKIDNAEEEGEAREFKTSGGGGGSLNRDDVNDTSQDITDVLVYNTSVGKAPVRATIANIGKKILSILKLTWLTSNGEGEISNANTFFTEYKDIMATVLEDTFDAKGAASQALTDAKKYSDDNFQKKSNL